MAKKRIKYNWLYMIHDLDLDKSFEAYVANSNLKRHLKGKKDISLNRLARAFMCHEFKFTGLDFRDPCYIVGQEEPYLDMRSRVLGVEFQK